jgi:hypothetical protein
MKHTVMKMVMAAVGVATFALAPTAFAGDRHRIPLPHEVLGLPPPPHVAILGAFHGHRGHSNHNYRKDYRDDHRHGHRNNGRHYGRDNRHHGRREWRDDRHHNHGRHNGHDRRSDYRDGKRDDRGRGGHRRH